MLGGQLLLTGINIPKRYIVQVCRLLNVMGVALLLTACASRMAPAPVVDLTYRPPPSPPVSTSAEATAPVDLTPSAIHGPTHMVVPGDTLYSIARHQGVDLAHLMRWNNISDSRHLVVGQVLRLSSAPADSVTVTGHSMATLPTLPMPGDKAKNEPIFLPPLAEKTSTSVAPQAIAKEPSAARTAAAKNLNWHWPARGRIIQPFNNHTKGIDIAGYSGEPVTAAADGKVMYSGNGVRGLGNLIIINHRSGFITAYAHNRKLLVKTGQEIKRGTQIAELGDSDTISPPRLHFEIRLQGTPVDPLQYLPPVPSQ